MRMPTKELHGFVTYDNAAIQTGDGTRLPTTVTPLWGKGKKAATVVGYDYAVEYGGTTYCGRMKRANPAREPITLTTVMQHKRAAARKPRFYLRGVTAEQVAFSLGKLYVQAFRDGDIVVKDGWDQVPVTDEIRALARELTTKYLSPT